MASAASPQQSLADVFECPVCLDSFKDPRVLPACGHIFCKECIEKVHVMYNGTVSCPTCRKVSGEVEKFTQISELAKSYIVNELHQRYFKEKRKEKIVHFSACCSKKAEPAKYYCNKCQLYLCDPCERQHQEGSLFEGHITEPMDSVTFCKAHESQKVSHYCRPCNEFICSGCAISKHNGHAAVDITIEAANCRKAGNTLFSELEKQLTANKQKQREAKLSYHAVKRNMEEVEKHLRYIKELAQTQSEIIKSAQNANRLASNIFVRKFWPLNKAIRRDQIKVNEILSEEMTDCQVIDKYQELRELDTDYNKEEEIISVYDQFQAISDDVRSGLSILKNSVQNFPGNLNAEPSPFTSASKRPADQSSHRQKRTKTVQGCSSPESPTHDPSSPEITSSVTEAIPSNWKRYVNVVSTKLQIRICATPGPQQSTTDPQTTAKGAQGTPNLPPTTPGPKQPTTRPQNTFQSLEERIKLLRTSCAQQ